MFNETVVKEYDLVCERASTSNMFILFFNIGLTLGPILSGRISEALGEFVNPICHFLSSLSKGRIRAIVLGSVLTIAVNLLLGLNPYGGPWTYAVTRMIAIVCGMIIFSRNYVPPVDAAPLEA